jgi:hypothetical protein
VAGSDPFFAISRKMSCSTPSMADLKVPGPKRVLDWREAQTGGTAKADGRARWGTARCRAAKAMRYVEALVRRPASRGRGVDAAKLRAKLHNSRGAQPEQSQRGSNSP